MLTGGIASVLLGIVTTILGIVFVVLGGTIDDVLSGLGNAIRAVGLVVAGFGAFGVVGGIGAIMRRQWGRVCAIVYGGINLALAILGLIGSLTGGDGVSGGTVFYVVLSAAIVGFCATGPASR